jgi:capsule polysaccharide export protein KpsE/RkpR
MPNKPKFSDYLYVIFRWKKFFIINLAIILIISVIISLLIPTTYKASSTIMLPKEDKMSGLSGLLSSAVPLLGGGVLGSSSGSDQVMGILKSRTLATIVADRFNLFKYYGLKEKNYDKVLKYLDGDVSFDLNENLMIDITVINESPDTSAEMVNYVVKILDSINTNINMQQAKNNREFIEIRYKKNLTDLATAEDSMKLFQQKYGIFAVPEQLEIAIKAAGVMEAQVVQQELILNTLKSQQGENAPAVINQQNQINFIKDKLKELSYSDKLSSKSVVMFPFKKVPEMAEIYFRNYRQIQVQGKIMEVILPLYEKAKIDEQKSIPTVIVLDRAIPPQIKYQPKRAFIVLGITFPFFFIMLLIAFRGNKALINAEPQNPVEVKETAFYKRLNNLYKMNLDS